MSSIEGESFGIGAEARSEERNHLWGEQKRHGEQQRLGGKQHREDAVGKQPRRGAAAFAANARIGRNEGGIEGALGEDGAKMIGQAQGDKERIRYRSGTEDRRQHDVAQKSGDARDERQAADGHDAFEHGSLTVSP